jgi:DNA-binding NtrC family response regulator
MSIALVNNALDGLTLLRNQEFDVILVSLPVPDRTSAANLLEELQQAQPGTPVVIHAPDARPTEIVGLVRLGAFHVFEHGDATSLLYMAANTKLAAEYASQIDDYDAEPWRRLLIGESRPMQQIAQCIRLVAPRRSTVLVTGETGTGKEIVAQSIHAASNRRHLPMVSVNCSALPEALLEAELFGHVKGAFTGAMSHRVGRFEQANHSTIFLDEIGDMPLSLQAKLLGSSENVRVDVRLIAATHAELAQLIKQNKFREDLYYRLNVVPIPIAPLRERPSDVPFLVQHFIEKVCREEGMPAKSISRETLDRLASHDWPGNVRQLENAVEKAIVLSGERPSLFPGDFPLPPRTHPVALQPGTQSFIALPDQGLDFERTVGSIELNILEQALKKTGGNKKLAAEMLGLKRTTLSAKLKSLAAVGAAG